MKTAIVKIESVSPYSQSRFHDTEKLNKELPDAYEKRTWREKCHAKPDGELFIPGMALKWSVAEAAKYLSLKIKGKGQATYTKHFDAGIMITDDLMLGAKKDTVRGEWVHCNSDGKRGSGKRVMRCFPVVDKWEATATIYILDDIIDEDVLREHLVAAGNFIGLGRFRPRNGGIFGRFKAKIVKFE